MSLANLAVLNIVQKDETLVAEDDTKVPTILRVSLKFLGQGCWRAKRVHSTSICHEVV